MALGIKEMTVTKYKLKYRMREDEPKDESVIVPYDLDAISSVKAKRKAGIKFEAEHHRLEPSVYDIDIQLCGNQT